MNEWPVNEVATALKSGSFEFYAEKDRKMAEDADYGFMIWDGKSRGTLNDAIMLTNQGKSVLIYFMPQKKFFSFKSSDTLNGFISSCGEEAIKVYNALREKQENRLSSAFTSAPASQQQISFFDCI